MHQYSHYTGPRRRETKDHRKIFEEITAENFPNMGKEINKPSPRSTGVPGRINPRRNTLKIHSNQTDKNWRISMLKATVEKWQITRELPPGYQLVSQQKLHKPEGKGMIYLKWWRGKTYNQEDSTQQDSLSDLMEKSKAFQTSKVKRIQHHQTSFITNAKGTSVGKKQKRRPTENKPQTLRKW